MGQVINRPGRKSLYIKFYNPAKGYTVTESAETTDYRKAEKKLREREGAKDRGEPVIPGAGRILMTELFDLVVTDYRNQENRTTKKVEQRIKKHLEPYFGAQRACSIGFAELEKYKSKRKATGAKKATVNRELAIVRRGFKLAQKAKKIAWMPQFEMLDEKDNVREGFFTVEEFLQLLPHLPSYLRPLVEFAYCVGWRSASLCALKWQNVNRVDCVITLVAKYSKNKRTYRFHYKQNAEVKELIEKQWERKSKLEGQTGRDIVNVFFHNNGRKIKDFSGSWEAAFKRAEMPAKIFHDLRRTAVRNMVKAGIPEKTAMNIAGLATRSIFDRYNIVSIKDSEEAAARIGINKEVEYQIEYQKAENEKAVTVSN